jgi:hypothetical protein
MGRASLKNSKFCAHTSEDIPCELWLRYIHGTCKWSPLEVSLLGRVQALVACVSTYRFREL